LIYRFVELPDLRASVRKELAADPLRARWEEGSFSAEQFKKKVMSGEMIGFGASPNTFAAMLVMLGLAAAGAALQRWRDRDEWGWYAAVAVAFVPALYILYLTRSRTALATPVLGAVTVLDRMERARIAEPQAADHLLRGGRWIHRGRKRDGCTRRLPRHAVPRQSHVPVAILGWCVQDLPRAPAARRRLRQLRLVLPWRAPAESRPKKCTTRTTSSCDSLVETGIVGGILVLAWLARLWWKLTEPRLVLDDRGSSPTAIRPLRLILLLAAAAVVVNVLASVDLAQERYRTSSSSC
jgi:hypothetical protein